MMEYIAVAEEGGEPIEIELEEDLSIYLSTLSSEFGSGIAGLSYRNPSTGLRRIVRTSIDGTRVNPPRSGWSSGVTYLISRVKGIGEEIVPVAQPGCSSASGVKMTPEVNENAVSVKEELVTKTAATASSGKKRLTKSALLKMQGQSAVARNAVHSWNTLNTTIRRLVQATQWEGSAGMTKCEGTTKEEAMVNRGKREALVKDKRVVQHFCQYELECEDGVGAVVLDYNHAVDHVRHCLNSMKKFGSFATVKVELAAEDLNGAEEKNLEIVPLKAVQNKHEPDAMRTAPQKAAKRRKVDDVFTPREENENEKENEIEEDYLKRRERRIHENKEMLFSLGMVTAVLLVCLSVTMVDASTEILGVMVIMTVVTTVTKKAAACAPQPLESRLVALLL